MSWSWSRARRELFRLGLIPAQSRAWKERYRQVEHDDGPEPKPGDDPASKPGPQRLASKPEQEQSQGKSQGGETESKLGQAQGQSKGQREEP